MSRRSKETVPSSRDSIRSILNLAQLSLTTDAAKRDSDGRALSASDVLPNLVQKLSRWIVNGNLRLRSSPAGWRLTYHVSFLAGSSDLLTGNSRGEPTGSEWLALKQAMQQPPFWFRYNSSDNSWNSNIARMENWVFTAISDRTRVVESYLLETAIPSGRISFSLDENKHWSFSSFQTYIFQLEELLYILEKGYDFEHQVEKDDRDNDVWVRKTNSPLPESFLQAIDKRQRQVERAREEARLRAEREERERLARIEVEEAARFGRQQMREKERQRLLELQRKEERKYNILNAYINNGEDSVSEEDLQWFKETFEEAIQEAVSKLVLKQHEDKLKITLARLPVASTARGQKLKYWQMTKIIEVVLETVARMSDAVIRAFKTQGLDPVVDARAYTASVRTKLRLPIPSKSVTLYVRTVPSSAKVALKSATYDERAAVEWSMLFEMDSQDRSVVNRSLEAAGYASVQGGAQIQVRSVNTLVVALNGLWEESLPAEVKDTAHLWNLTASESVQADLSDTPRRAASAATAPTPDADAVPKPAPDATDSDGFRPKKRNL